MIQDNLSLGAFVQTKQGFGVITGLGECVGTIRVKDSKNGTHTDYLPKHLKAVQVIPVQNGDSITIIGRRWFDRINGNTYFSAVALINGKEVAQIPFEYGYGNQYEHSMFNKLFGLGYCADRKTYENGSTEPFWVYCDRKGITKYVSHSDVRRKKDL